jgi:hypothetical protein
MIGIVYVFFINYKAAIFEVIKVIFMSLLNQQNGKKGKKANKQTNNFSQAGNFAQKPGKTAGFVKKQITTSAKRGS